MENMFSVCRWNVHLSQSRASGDTRQTQRWMASPRKVTLFRFKAVRPSARRRYFFLSVFPVSTYFTVSGGFIILKCIIIIPSHSPARWRHLTIKVVWQRAQRERDSAYCYNFSDLSNHCVKQAWPEWTLGDTWSMVLVLTVCSLCPLRVKGPAGAHADLWAVWQGGLCLRLQKVQEVLFYCVRQTVSKAERISLCLHLHSSSCGGCPKDILLKIYYIYIM